MFQKMNTNSLITNRCGRVYFTFSHWLKSFLIAFVADSFRDMLSDSVLKTLRSSAHVPEFAAAHVLVYDHALLRSRKNVCVIAGRICLVEKITLANIFVGFYESKLFDKISQPQIFYRYVDDTFALFQDEVDSETFLTNLISLHTSLKFTSKKKVNQSLPFLDVSVTKSTNNFTTSVYRKATFTGEYIRWNSFGPKTRKTNPIATLTQRAFKFCSKSSLQ